MRNTKRESASRELAVRYHPILPLIITILIMAFIFFQSALPADVSTKESNLIVIGLADWLDADVDTVSFVVRKCGHFLEYMLLGASLLWTVRSFWSAGRLSRASGMRDVRRERGAWQGHAGKTGREWNRKMLLVPWIIGTAYAVSDEVHQMFVPGRSCEVRDVLIDSGGIAVGILIGVAIAKTYRRRKG